MTALRQAQGERLTEQGLRQAQPERSGGHWADAYLDDRWEAGADGPHAWDCWTFFRHVQLAHYGREVPRVGVDAGDIHAVAHAFGRHEERARWQEVEAASDGDAVLLAHSRYPSHVGIWLEVDGGGVLHCQNGAGVLFTPLGKLAACGWGRVNFFRPISVSVRPDPEPRRRIEGHSQRGQGFDRLSPNGSQVGV